MLTNNSLGFITINVKQIQSFEKKKINPTFQRQNGAN